MAKEDESRGRRSEQNPIVIPIGDSAAGSPSGKSTSKLPPCWSYLLVMLFRWLGFGFGRVFLGPGLCGYHSGDLRK